MRSLPIGLILLLVCTSCTKPAEPPVQSALTAEQFIDIFVQLRNAQTKNAAPQDYARAKQQILRKAGATEDDLRQFVKVHSNQITLMASVWDSVQSRISRGDTIAR